MISISLQPELIATIQGVSITNTSFTTLLVTCLIISIALIFSIKQRKKTQSRLVNYTKVVFHELLKFVDSITNDRQLSKKLLPILLSFFSFIMLSNLVGLLPGFLGSLYTTINGEQVSLLRAPTSDINTTLALAISSMTVIQIVSLKSLGLKKYLSRFVNFSSPINLMLGFFELVSEILKIFSFAFRLFGNIFAAEVLLIVIALLIPYLLPVPFMMLEVFGAFIQAWIFITLTLVFTKTVLHTKH